ncbi:MAG: hypothetical protein ACJ76W_10115 [Chloroflexota bacterium]
MDVLILIAVAGVAWAGLVLFALRGSRFDPGELLTSPLGRVAVGLGVGLLVGLLILVARADVIPDVAEPSLFAAVMVATGFAAVVIGVRSWMERTR